MKNNHIDKEIIHLLQGDLPLTARPYEGLAEALQITEEEIVERIRALQTIGQLRRMGAILRHRTAGFTANAMVVWKADPAEIDAMGELMAAHKEVSHCYYREVSDGFDYPLFTMIHARNDDELAALVKQLSVLTGMKEYKIVKSTRELKKISMSYV